MIHSTEALGMMTIPLLLQLGIMIFLQAMTTSLPTQRIATYPETYTTIPVMMILQQAFHQASTIGPYQAQAGTTGLPHLLQAGTTGILHLHHGKTGFPQAHQVLMIAGEIEA
jgi:hypothetical protein